MILKKSFVRVGVAVALGIALTGPSGAARADEIADEIRNALELYESGKVAEAKDALEFAAQLLAQRKASGLEALFPEPLSGWSAEDTGSAAGAMPFGGGITGARRYVKGGQSVNITIIGDSPMIQGLAMMFGNPAMAGSAGAKAQRIKGQRALVTPEGDIKILVGQFLVQIEGSAPAAAKMQYANALPFDDLAKF